MRQVCVLTSLAAFVLTVGTVRAQSSAPLPPPTPVPTPSAIPTATAVAPPGAANGQLPPVPQWDPRPLEGQETGQRFQLQRSGAAAAPVAGFVEPLRSNDAVLELVLEQGRLLTLKSDVATRGTRAAIAVGDPTILEFVVMPDPRMIRLLGLRAGVTDLSITTSDGQSYNFEVQVLYDLPLLRAQLRQVFPDAQLELRQMRDHLVVEGQARSPAQVSEIIATLTAYLSSMQPEKKQQGTSEGDKGGAEAGLAPIGAPGAAPGIGPTSQPPSAAREGAGGAAGEAGVEQRGDKRTSVTQAKAQIVNLIRVPGVHQVMLQVRLAELNRTAIRNIGADVLWMHPSSGTIMGTNIGGGEVSAGSVFNLGGMSGSAAGGFSTNSTNTQAFGIFPTGHFEVLLHALRKNSLLSILAEPNLVTMSGHQANFLAGGEFPVPVSQTSSGTISTTVVWKEFGVKLEFIPYVLDDNVIRLTVKPEVSTIDYSLGVTLVPGGSPTPGVNTRKADTTVEMREGQTLAMAGLLQVAIDGSTSRIPGLGDLPYIGPLFSNTTHQRVEKELIVLVTPHLVAPMNPDQICLLPGQEVTDPNDLEFYLLNRLEGRTGRDVRSTRTWEDPQQFVRILRLEQRCVSGPVGVSP